MAKFNVIVTVEYESTFDPSESDEFATTKDELVDKRDPTDLDVIHDYIRELIENDGIEGFDDSIWVKKVIVIQK